MASRAFKQDLPPKGGYAPITFKRIPAKVVFGGKLILALGIGTHVAGWAYHKFYSKPIMKLRVLERCGVQNALAPLLLAERDRHYIKACRANRDAEADLMADVPGWEVGTWYGEKVYKTVPDEQLLHYYSLGRTSPEFGVHYEPSAWRWEQNEIGHMYT